jgi:hypothetical protein
MKIYDMSFLIISISLVIMLGITYFSYKELGQDSPLSNILEEIDEELAEELIEQLDSQ